MRTKGVFVGGAFTTALVARALMAPVPVGDKEFTLAHAIPGDVFMYVGERNNPERKFVDDYWGEVLDAVQASGIGDDVMEMVGSLLDADQTAEMNRLKDRAKQLLDGVDWEALDGGESAFAERFDLPVPAMLAGKAPPLFMADMVWLMRGKGAAHNYTGLVNILEAIADEVNTASGSKGFVVHETKRSGAKVASLNLLSIAPGAPPLPLSVALRDDVVIIALRGGLFNDVLRVMDDSESMKSLGGKQRFRSAFAKLPKAEDGMTFFDMKTMLEPLRAMFDSVVDLASAAPDVTKNTGMSDEAAKFNASALSAYRSGDYKKALALTREAHEVDDESTFILYNLACFSALSGHEDKALDWLSKAVEGGFHAPKKIAGDSDLDSLRDLPRYKASLARAAELAKACCVKDIVVNASDAGELYRLRMQIRQAYEDDDYERGLQFAEQAYAIAPKDSRVLYSLACLHSVLGHEKKSLKLLEQAVDAGFYCPQHIGQDPDWKHVRKNKRFRLAAANAGEKAAMHSSGSEEEWATTAKQLYGRIMDAVGVIDFTATVATTDGYSTYGESITVLVPDAKDRPIYPIFEKRHALTDFSRYLPKETASFSISGGADLTEVYKFLEDSVRLAGKKGEELLAKWSAIQEQVGVDVRKDVLGWIDGDSISVTLAGGRGSVWLMKVSDDGLAKQKVGETMKFVSTQLSENLAQAAAKNPALAGLAMMSIRTTPLEDERLDGFENIHFAMAPQPAVWGVADGYLVFGSSADAAALCLATASGDHPSIRKNKRVMKEALVPDGRFVGVTLTDRRNLGKELATATGVGSMVVGMMGPMIPQPEVRPLLTKIAGMLGKLTPVVQKIDFYKSAATQTTFDGKMWRQRSVTHYFAPTEKGTPDTE